MKKNGVPLADFHIHCFDCLANPKGITVKEILDEAIKNNVKYLSFTSHDTLDEYDELLKVVKESSRYDDLHILVGVEISSLIEDDLLRDFLIYMPFENISKFKRWIDKNAKGDFSLDCQRMQLDHFKKVAFDYGFLYDDDLDVKEGEYAGSVFVENLAKYKENYLYDKKLENCNEDKFDCLRRLLKKSKFSMKEIISSNPNIFFSEIVRPKESPFNVDKILKKVRPKLEELIEHAHHNNAFVLVAHPFHLDRDKILNYLDLCKNYGIDGVESFYITETSQFYSDKEFVEQYCIKNNLLYGSGGTDFHTLSGVDYLGLGIIGNKDSVFTLTEDDIPDWIMNLVISIQEIKSL